MLISMKKMRLLILSVLMTVIFMAMPAFVSAASTITAPANGTVYTKGSKVTIKVKADEYVESNGTHYCNVLAFSSARNYLKILDVTKEYNQKGANIEVSFDAMDEGDYLIYVRNYYLVNGFKNYCGNRGIGVDAGYEKIKVTFLPPNFTSFGYHASAKISVKSSNKSGATQKIVIKSNTKNVNVSSLQKNAYTFKLSASAKGKITFKKVSGSKQLSISESGTVTVKNKTKKGSYSMKVKAIAAAKGNYKKAEKSFTVTVKVK